MTGIRGYGIAVALVLALSTASFAGIVGNAVVDRPLADGAWKINFIDLDLVFPEAGRIDSWSIYGEASGDLGLQVYRHDTGNDYLLVGENLVSTDGTGLQAFTIAPSDRILVEAGDIIGWRFEGSSLVIGQGVIDYTNSGSAIRHTIYPNSNPTVGGSLTFAQSGNRTYSIAADYSSVPEPASVTLLACGLGLLAWRVRRRRKSAV